jgi:hypothetical protein
MNPPRMMLASAGALFRVAGAVLQSMPTLIIANHLFAAPFGAQLDDDFDSAEASWPSPCLSAELRALEGDRSSAHGRRDIHAARLPALRPPQGESS